MIRLFICAKNRIAVVFRHLTLAFLLTAALTIVFPVSAQGQTDTAPEKDPSIVILYTNDIHCNYDKDIGYDGLVLYRKELEQQYEYVVSVDGGDAIQGAPMGAISQGREIIRMMNEAGYDIATLGNHEFDFGFEVLDDRSEELQCSYICANFCTADEATVFAPYKIIECGETRVAFISVDTPETFSKSRIHELIDDQGVPMYDFLGENEGEVLYATLQQCIDEVNEKGADFVILVGHLGNSVDSESAFRSREVLSHLTGIDAVLDGHSHEVYNTTAKDAEGKDIPMIQTGCFFQNVGTMTLHPDGSITAAIIPEIPAPEPWMEGINAVCVTRKGTERWVDAEMHQFLEDITSSYADVMNQRIGEVSYDMIVRTEAGEDISRRSENGLCELVADAFRETAQTEIAFVTAGSVRNNLPAGDITFNDIMNILPYSNDILIAEMKGQVILNALEFGWRNVPIADGGFPQVSGMEYTVDLSIESTVQTDENGDFAGVAGGRRVRDVMVNGAELVPEANYTVAACDFLLKGGDHYKMFADDAEIIGTTQKTDNILLMDYIRNDLSGVIPDQYQQTTRITLCRDSSFD